MRLKSSQRIVFFILTILSSSFAQSQISIPGDPSNLIDKSADTTTLSLYSSISYEDVTSSFKGINPMVKFSFNKSYPRGYNDGPVWKGEGMNGEAHAGFIGKKGKISYALFPVVFFAQNGSFINGQEEKFAYPFSNRIDWVQRYGDGSYTQFHLGQSEIRASFGVFSASLSTQNYSLGPSVYNPILLSRQGGGFPHARLGIGPTELVIRKKNLGKVEGQILYGIMRESDYFDNNSENDNRYFNALILAYSPSFLPELTVGINKVLYKQTRFFETSDLYSYLFIADDGVVDGDTLSPNDAFDQMASITAEWNQKEVGLRVYVEFAKNDFTGSASGFRFFAIEPEHSRAYTIGFEKIIQTKKGHELRINYEHTNLSRNHTFLWRPAPTFYAHGINRQGYTHNGQLVGAGIGPGGNSDHLGITIDKKTSKAGVLLQRIEHNKDYFVVNIQDANLHDIEYSAGIFYQRGTERFNFIGELTFSHNYNKFYLFDRPNTYLSIATQFKIFND